MEVTVERRHDAELRAAIDRAIHLLVETIQKSEDASEVIPLSRTTCHAHYASAGNAKVSR